MCVQVNTHAYYLACLAAKGGEHYTKMLASTRSQYQADLQLERNKYEAALQEVRAQLETERACHVSYVQKLDKEMSQKLIVERSNAVDKFKASPTFKEIISKAYFDGFEDFRNRAASEFAGQDFSIIQLDEASDSE